MSSKNTNLHRTTLNFSTLEFHLHLNFSKIEFVEHDGEAGLEGAQQMLELVQVGVEDQVEHLHEENSQESGQIFPTPEI